MKKFVFVLLPIFAFILLACNSEEEEVQVPDSGIQEISQEKETTPINYEVLSEFNPYGDNNNLGLNILIDEVDATEESITELLRELGRDFEVANIRVYQDKKAFDYFEDKELWEDEEQIEISKKGYLAYYIKTASSNEIKWFQEKGQLEHLYGTKTEL